MGMSVIGRNRQHRLGEPDGHLEPLVQSPLLRQRERVERAFGILFNLRLGNRQERNRIGVALGVLQPRGR